MSQASIQGSHGRGRQVLTVVSGGETYAMPIRRIKEILEYVGETPVPLMPPFVRGVMNVRGAVVPVIDLAVRFGGKPTARARRTCVVVVEMGEAGERLDIGVLVDAVSEVLDLDSGALEPPPTFGAGIRADFIDAMARLHGHFVIVLALDRVLSIDDMVSLARIASRPVAA